MASTALAQLGPYRLVEEARRQAAKTALVAPAPQAVVASHTLRERAKRIKTSTGESFIVKGLFQTAQNKIHFINTNRYSYHYDFASQELGYSATLEAFNQNYVLPGEQREFIAFSLVVPNKEESEAFLLELWSGDYLEGVSLVRLYEALAKELPENAKLLLHPLSREQEIIVEKTLQKNQYILTSELLGERNYIALNEGVAFGYLKLLEGNESDQTALADLNDIVVYRKVPNDLGLVGGVITEELQTPLSHVNVKSINRGTANMYLKDATTTLRAYEGKPVELHVGANGYSIRELSVSEADGLIAKFWKEKKPQIKVELKSVLDPVYENQFVPLAGYYTKLPKREDHSQLIQRIGAKAANLALLDVIVMRLKDPLVSSPEAFGIPFNFYEKFIQLKQAGLDASNPQRVMTPQERTIEILKAADLLNPDKIHPIAIVRPVLAEVRAMVQKAQLPREMLDVFKKLIIDDVSSPIHISKTPRIRLRSSTNSEDLEGFTGAGLYESDGISLYKKTADKHFDRAQPKAWAKIEQDLKEVVPFLYASVWNERAFLEREWYSINGTKHLDVKVGLALHHAFPLLDFNPDPGELANGVAVTANIYAPEELGKIYLNAQHFDLSVTNPPLGEDLKTVGEDPLKPYATEETLVTSFTAVDDLNQNPDSWRDWPVERIRRSSVRVGQAVLNTREDSSSGRDDVRILSRALWRVNRSMAYVYGRESHLFSVDVEWKIYGPKRQIILKQVRPFMPVGPK